jgi:hypothetical protein
MRGIRLRYLRITRGRGGAARKQSDGHEHGCNLDSFFFSLLFLDAYCLDANSHQMVPPPAPGKAKQRAHAGSAAYKTYNNSLEIDDIDRVALKIFLQVINRDVHQSLAAFLGRPGDMGRDEAVLRLKQGVSALMGSVLTTSRPAA